MLSKTNNRLIYDVPYLISNNTLTIPGWIRNNKKEYGYVEISGYYLTYLAFLLESKALKINDIETNAIKIINRLDEIISLNFPEGFFTRCFLETKDLPLSDWRNSFLFSFDLGMVIKGLYATVNSNIGNKTFILSVLEKYLKVFQENLVTNNQIISHKIIRNGIIEPKKRSTLDHIHHLKTASSFFGISSLNNQDWTELIIKNTRDRWNLYFLDRDLEVDIHPTLYYIEGLINYYNYKNDKNALQESYEIITKILSKIDQDGFIPSNIHDGEGKYFRSDIIAQILRAGTILASFGYGNIESYTKLVNCLKQNFEGDNGAISFFPLEQSNETSKIYRNVRCSMFTSQALSFYYQFQTEGKINKKLLGFII